MQEPQQRGVEFVSLYVDDNASVAHREEPLTLLLQYADTWSGFVLENPQKKRKLHSQHFAPLCREYSCKG